MLDQQGQEYLQKKPTEHLGLKIRPQSIKDKAIESQRLFSQMKISPTPYSKFAQSVAESDSVLSKTFKSVIDNLGQMTNISPLYVTSLESVRVEDFNREGLLKMRTQDILNCSEELKKIGVNISPDELSAIPNDEAISKIMAEQGNLVDEEGLIGVIVRLQSEYFNILHATRAIEETRLIFEKAAPFVSWPKKNILATTLNNDAIGDLNGYYGLGSNQHIAMLREPNDEALNYQTEVNERNLTMTGKKAATIVIAAHEVIGHAGFSELFDEEDAKEVFEIGKESARRTDPRLLTSLNEGHAMFIEDIAIEKLETPEISEDSQSTLESLDGLREWRKERLVEQANNPISRIYPDGKVIINKLLEQLGVKDSSKEKQLQSLRAKLSTLDIVSMSKLKPEHELYLKCLKDPLGNLPIKKS